MQGLLYRRRRLYTREKREERGSKLENEIFAFGKCEMCFAHEISLRDVKYSAYAECDRCLRSLNEY